MDEYKDFKDGDVVVILGYNELDNWPIKEIEKIISKNSIKEIKENPWVESLLIDYFFVERFKLRHATDREKLLYYTYGIKNVEEIK